MKAYEIPTYLCLNPTVNPKKCPRKSHEFPTKIPHFPSDLGVSLAGAILDDEVAGTSSSSDDVSIKSKGSQRPLTTKSGAGMYNPMGNRLRDIDLFGFISGDSWKKSIGHLEH